jgi:hypothetical protein
MSIPQTARKVKGFPQDPHAVVHTPRRHGARARHADSDREKLVGATDDVGRCAARG